jgi:galactarate dehydratase
MVREMAWYDAYLGSGGADRSANTTPGNKKGGLANIVEKAMGSIVKSGTAPIVGVPRAGRAAARPGLDERPGLRGDAGERLHLRHAAARRRHERARLHTGRGTPYGLAEAPVVKVATTSGLARRWHDLMDVNAGTIADGTATIEETGWALFRRLLDVASGERSCAERLGCTTRWCSSILRR